MDSQPTIFVPPPGKQNGRSSSPNNERWVPAPPQPKRRRIWLWLLLFLGFGFFVALLLLGGIAYFYTSNWILPGTTVLGRNIGGMTQAEATAVLMEDWQHRPITLSDGHTPYNYTPNDLGMTLDTAATVNLAYQQGRTAASLGQLLRSVADVPPVWSYDPAQAEALLNHLAEELYTPPANAGVMLVDDKFIVTPPFDGIVLDVAVTLDAINRNPAQVLITGGAVLMTQSVPPAVADTALVEAKIGDLRLTAVSLHAYDPIRNERRDIAIDPATWSQWVSLGMDASSQLVWQLDEVALAGYLDG
ncbi:MAG: peptidoglycan binding domain-containing protein [Anaerolineales bacterium]|nr:peptidoglycan binding domain-containing protein [Anaerolineales bacterium]